MEQKYVFCVFEIELHEGRKLCGVYADRYRANDAIEKLKVDRDLTVFSYYIETVELNATLGV